MLLAIDVGNTQTVYGLHDGSKWLQMWRRDTDAEDTEDELAAWLFTMFQIAGIPFHCDQVVTASVVPSMDDSLARLAKKFFQVSPLQLKRGDQVGLKVSYTPPHAVGADRIANALGALDRFKPPIVVVDFGTATTFDVIDAEGSYVGGAILPGIMVSTQALISRAAKLPSISFHAPETAIGKTTEQSLQSGIVLGYAGSIDTLARKIRAELGGACKVIATGGLAPLFHGVSEMIEEVVPELTLDGLRIAAGCLSSAIEG